MDTYYAARWWKSGTELLYFNMRPRPIFQFGSLKNQCLLPIRRLIANVARFQVILHCKVSLNLFGPGFVKPFGYLISCQSYYSWFRIRFGVTLNSLCGVLVE